MIVIDKFFKKILSKLEKNFLRNSPNEIFCVRYSDDERTLYKSVSVKTK